jgi:hypothetical protein
MMISSRDESVKQRVQVYWNVHALNGQWMTPIALRHAGVHITTGLLERAHLLGTPRPRKLRQVREI